MADGVERILIREVRYVHELKMNQISLGMLEASSYMFKELDVVLCLKEQLAIMKATRSYGLYTLQGENPQRYAFTRDRTRRKVGSPQRHRHADLIAYFMTSTDDITGDELSLIYVDDILIACKYKIEIRRQFELKYLGGNKENSCDS
ncbi:Uncharacterized protein Fot_48542 [Forsythia ovata]|uniref:Reverse transcriptase Ty1/copia-type domain-containing protein n=1 Tax=Forsythia ovata TaxID=205694 RepID=A0ABD1Q9B5_9LAMI